MVDLELPSGAKNTGLTQTLQSQISILPGEVIDVTTTMISTSVQTV